MKKCAKCGEWKELDEYNVYSESNDGRQGYCKECNKKITKEYYYQKARTTTTEIYKITNTENDKVYIGRTHTGAKKRFKTHLYNARNIDAHKVSALYADMAELGYDKFSIEVIDTINSNDERECGLLENKYMQEYNSVVPNGYNIKTNRVEE